MSSIDDLENELVNNRKVQQSMNDGAFEVTPLDYDPDKEKQKHDDAVFKQQLSTYRSKAENLSIADNVLDAVDEMATPDTVTSFKDYMSLVDKYNASTDSEQSEEEDEDEKLYKQLLVKQEIARLSKLKDLSAELTNRIQRCYNTTAITADDLIREVETNEEARKKAQLGLYQQPVYSLLINIEEEWVHELIGKLHEEWESNDDAMDVILTYFTDKSDGDLTEDRLNEQMDKLIEILPDTIRNESSPKIYKAYRAACLLKQQGSNSTPIVKRAEGVTFVETSEEEQGQRSLSKELLRKAVSAHVSHTIAKQSGETKLDKAVQSVVDPETYAQYQQAKKEKAEAASERKAQKQETKEQQREERLEQQEQQRESLYNPRRSSYGNRQGNYYGNDTYGYSNSNSYEDRGGGLFSNRRNTYGNGYGSYGNSYGIGTGFGRSGVGLPPIVVGIILNVCLGLMSYILMPTLFAVIAVVGLAVSLVGFYKLKIHEGGAIAVIIGGYTVFIISIILSIMR